MKDVDLKTIFIGIFVLAFIFFGYQRMDIGRYQYNINKVLIDTKTGDIWIHEDMEWHSISNPTK